MALDKRSEPHDHTWEQARDTRTYSPLSYRHCRACGLLQVLKCSGWTDLLYTPTEG